MKEPRGGYAFPFTEYYDEKPYGESPGMFLRDYFAAKAMQAEIITTFSDATPEAARAFLLAADAAGQTVQERVAFNAYVIADAMLKAREKS
jgi:hypothetical protein